MRESFIVPINNPFKQGELILGLKKFINLLLIFNDSKFSFRVISNKF